MRNRNYFFLFFTFSFIIAQNSNELSPKKLKDISPNWPIIINNALDYSTSFDLVSSSMMISLDSISSIVSINSSLFFSISSFVLSNFSFSSINSSALSKSNRFFFSLLPNADGDLILTFSEKTVTAVYGFVKIC